MYKHQKLLQENVVDMTTFPDPIQNMIALFAEQEYELEEGEDSEETSSEELRALRLSLRELDKTLYKNIKSFIDHEASEELTGSDLKEAILQEYYRQGNTQLPLGQLRKAGYPVSNAVKINETVGAYRLVKRRYDTHCTILPRH